MRFFVSYAAHRESGGGFFGNVIVNTRVMERWQAAVMADAQRLAPGQCPRVVILSYQPLGAPRATDVIGYWIAAKLSSALRWVIQCKQIAGPKRNISTKSQLKTNECELMRTNAK